MATVTRTRSISPPNTDGLRPYRLTVAQFHKMLDAGVFPHDARVELLGGVLAEQMTKLPPHDFTVTAMGEALRAVVRPVAVVREEKAVILGPFWRPEPDIAVATGPLDRYRRSHPRPKDLPLLVEVSESTYSDDRGVKWVGYAAAKVLNYWIVNLNKRVVEAYSNPIGRGKSARYRDAKHYAEGDSIPVVIDGRELGAIAVSEILP